MPVLRHLCRQHRGAGVAEAIVTVAMFSLLALSVFQTEMVITRQTRLRENDSVAHHALRQALVHITNDLLVATGASANSNILTLTRTIDNEPRQVEYQVQDGGLRRTETDAEGAVVTARNVASGLTAFTVTYDATYAVLSYTMAAAGDQGRTMTLDGSIHLRNVP